VRQAWIGELSIGAPDIVEAWWGIDEGRFLSVRREVRRRAGARTAPRIAGQLGATADALARIVTELPDAAFAAPGGEGDWNVAQAIGHVADARGGLTLAASLAAMGRWPPDTPPVVPGVPGPTAASREVLLRRIRTSQRLAERAAERVVGHELDDCPLVHPWVGQLRCGEWLLFAGVHDMMHLEQLHDLQARLVEP
jgi:DinB family protein